MDERFRDNEACREYIRRLRWPKGFTCLHCGEVGEPMGDGGRMIGTRQGGVQHQHLNYYLDEFTFRFNRRRSKARGLLFHRLAQQALAAGPAPYNAIVKPAGSSGSPTTGQ